MIFSVEQYHLLMLFGRRSEWIDVRDVALAHVLALQKEGAGGERIIISSGKWVWQDWGKLILLLLVM